MGCWGITAFESDAGLDAVICIRKNLPEDGKLDLDAVIQRLQQDGWNRPADVSEGVSHTSPMALAELMFQLMDHDLSRLDYPDERADKDKKFGSLTSFQASKDALQWLRIYLSGTLQSAVANAEQEGNWGGWFHKEDWNEWREHMASLVERLDNLLALPEDTIDLLTVQQPENGQIMKM